GDLVAQDQALGRRGAAADHVLVGAADVRREDLEDHPVLAAAADVLLVYPRPVLEDELRVVDGLHLDLAGAHLGDPAVAGHLALPASQGGRAGSPVRRETVPRRHLGSITQRITRNAVESVRRSADPGGMQPERSQLDPEGLEQRMDAIRLKEMLAPETL